MKRKTQANNANRDGAKEKQLALLALAINSPPPIGEKPDLDELIEWQEGRLPPSRADEVKSHVARDPEVCDLWLSLIKDHAVQKPKQPTVEPFHIKLKEWFASLTWQSPEFVSFAVTAALIVLVLPVWLNPATLSKRLEQDYSSTADFKIASGQWLSDFKQAKAVQSVPNSDLSKHSLPIGVGIHKGLQTLVKDGKLDNTWRNTASHYPSINPNCVDGNACPAWSDILENFGRWLALNHLYCITDSHSNATNSSEQLRDFITEAEAHQELAEFQQTLESWLSKAENHEQLCLTMTAFVAQLH